MGGCATIERLHGGELTNALAPQTWWPATQLLPRLLKAWACHPARRSYGRWCSSSNIGRTDPWSAVVHFLPTQWLGPCKPQGTLWWRAPASNGKQQLLRRSISWVPTTSDLFDRGEVSPLTLGLGFWFLFGSWLKPHLLLLAALTKICKPSHSSWYQCGVLGPLGVRSSGYQHMNMDEA
jgi:hypothetical protein